MRYLGVLICIVFFAMGFLSSMLLATSRIEMPLGISFNAEPNAPGDWIKEDQIHVYENAVVIDIENASIARYAPTGSMRPVLDSNSNGIKIVPKSENQINVGDIITFEEGNQLIVHRVVEIGKDAEGLYFVTKGDNNDVTDGKIRFKDVRYVTIGMLW